MNGRILAILLTLFGALAWGAASAHAGQPAPTAYPQWMTTFSREVLAYDNIAMSPGPTWVRLSNGDVVVVTSVGYGLLLRRYAPDGSVRQTHVESVDNFSDVIVKGDPTTDSLYVLTGALQYAGTIMRFDGDLHREWSLEIPYNGIGNGSYLGMEVLSDGSVLALRAFRLARIGRDSQVQWVIDNVDGGRSFLSTAMATSSDDTIWIAAYGGLSGGGSEAAVMRFDPDGSRLSADYVPCASCGGSYAIDVDTLSDGSASVVGGFGYGQPSFFARYSAAGERLLWADNADILVDYARVDHDGNGSIYVQTSRFPDETGLRRVDPNSGAVLWDAPGYDFTARDAGGVVTRKYAPGTSRTGIVAVALNDGGHELWSREISTSNYANVSRGSYVAGNVELLMQDFAPSASPCGTYPHLISLDASGAITTTPPACRTAEGSTYLQDIDAMKGVGVLANVMYRLVAFSPEGDLRWQAISCEWCTEFSPGDTQWGAAILTADGGAWAIEHIRFSPQLPDGKTSIKRIDANGKAIFSIPAAAQGADPALDRLLGTAQEVIALQPVYYGGGVTWQRVRNNGSVSEALNYPIPDPYFHIDDARRLNDGGVSLVTNGDVICTVGCPPRYVTLLRLAADGSLRWRYQFPEFDAAIALAEDGSATAALWSDPDGVVLRKIDSNGQTSEVVLTDVTPANPAQLAGPINGRWLLRTDGSFPSQQGLWLVDAAGNVMASRNVGSLYTGIRSTSSLGYLVEIEDIANAELLDPDSMATRGYFSIGSVTDPTNFGWPWRLLDDGSVYGTVPSHRVPSLWQMGVARFSVPGSPPSNLLFRDGFD